MFLAMTGFKSPPTIAWSAALRRRHSAKVAKVLEHLHRGVAGLRTPMTDSTPPSQERDGATAVSNEDEITAAEIVADGNGSDNADDRVPDDRASDDREPEETTETDEEGRLVRPAVAGALERAGRDCAESVPERGGDMQDLAVECADRLRAGEIPRAKLDALVTEAIEGVGDLSGLSTENVTAASEALFAVLSAAEEARAHEE
jgi:hypothetical protein